MNPTRKGSPAATASTPDPREIVLLEVEDWHEKALADPGSVRGYGIRRDAPAAEVKQAAGDDHFLNFVISTEEPDRDDDVIRVSGWDWKDYFRGGPGPVLFGHDRRSLPVGKCPKIDAVGMGLVAGVQFPTAAEAGMEAGQPFLANTVRCMALSGYLKSTSVGFMPVEWTYNEDRGGFDFKSQEGLEWSIVPIPANPGCFQLAAGAGIDLGPVDAWARKSLDEIHGRPGLYVTRSRLEMVLRSCGLTEGVKFFEIGDAAARRRLKAAAGDEAAVPDAAGVADLVERALEERGISLAALAQVLRGAPAQVAAEAPPAPAAEAPAAVVVAEVGEDVLELAEADPGEVLELDTDDLTTLRAEIKEGLRLGLAAALNEQTPLTGRVY